MKMEIDDEGTKTNEDSENNEQMAGDNTQESFEQNSSNTSQQNYDRNGKVFVNIIYLNGVHELKEFNRNTYIAVPYCIYLN